MSAGKPIILAMGMAALLIACPLRGGEAGLTSLRHNAVVTIGGEVRVDYSYRYNRSSGTNTPTRGKYGDLSVNNAFLRLQADVHPNVKALFKVNLSPDADDVMRRDDEIMEEALLVMHTIGGSGLEMFAGMGRAPYGQDITLGMIQSYHHAANRASSPEGSVNIIDPPNDVFVGPGDPEPAKKLPPMRPGQFDRAIMVGAAYEWDTRWRVEIAAFQPAPNTYDARFEGGRRDEFLNGSDIGFAGRVWWRPYEDLVVEVSGMAAHSTDMGRTGSRIDLAPGAGARTNAFAVSAGFDWRRGPWRVFGEYQHGWDWNFSDGYDVDIGQLGLSRDFAGNWRAGAAAEFMRIDDKAGKSTLDDFYKLCLNIRYTFSSGLFVLAEYGHEWFRRDRAGTLVEKRRGSFLGMRLGFNF